MYIIHAGCGKKILLGRTLENLACQVWFEDVVARWIELYGEGVVQLVVRRNTESEFTPREITMDGTKAVWTITDADTAIAGQGECVLSYHFGVDGLAKSATYQTLVIHSPDSTSDEVPEPYQGWVDQVLQAGSDAQNAAIQTAKDRAATEQAKEDAEAAAEQSVDAAGAAKTSETNSKASENAAKQSETAAAGSAAGAKASADAAALSEQNAKKSETASGQSEANAKKSEDAAALSEKNAKASQEAAVLSEKNAKTSETASAQSEANAKKSEQNAAQSETNAKTSADAAALSEQNSKASADKAALSEQNAKASENASKQSEETALDAANVAAQKAVEAAEYAAEDAPPIVLSSSGEEITLTDSAERPLKGLKLYGKTTQRVYEGGEIWDGVLEQGWINTSGVPVADARVVRSANFIPVNGGWEITVSNDMEYYCYVFEYDENQAFIKYSVARKDTYTLTLQTNTRYIKIRSDQQNAQGDLSVVYSIVYGDGTAFPSPEKPEYPVSVGDSGTVNVNLHGKNLFHRDYEGVATKSGVTWDWDADNQELVLNGTTTEVDEIQVNDYLYIDWVIGEEYTVSVRRVSGTAQLPSDVSGGTYAWKILSVDTSEYIRGSVGEKAFNDVYSYVGAAIDGKRYILYLQLWKVGTVFNNYRVKVQIEKGSSVTDWEPYQVPQTLPVGTPNGLPGLPVSSDGNHTDASGQQWICDEVDFGRGVYEHWTGLIESYAGEAVNGVYMSSTGELSEGATVLYALDIPYETPLTAEELAAYAALHTNKPTTVITNDGGAEMDVEYVADTKLYIDNKFAELRTAILSLGGNV